MSADLKVAEMADAMVVKWEGCLVVLLDNEKVARLVASMVIWKVDL